jgi:hypothetical protein
MNRVSLQAFSAGIIFATAIFTGFYYGSHLNEEATFTISDAQKMLEAQGYSISKSNIKNRPEETKTNNTPEEVAKQATETKTKQEAKKQEKVVSYILKIKSKMTTSEIAELLEKEKIIDDATTFQDYMNHKKLSRQVQIGEYIVSSDMSDEELGKLVTQ